MADTAHSTAAPVVVCVKWVALRPDVDRLTGTVHTDDRWSGASPADLAAVEWAKSIRNPDCLVVEEIARGRIELQQIRLEPGSPALAVPLRELGLPARVRIGAILLILIGMVGLRLDGVDP